MAMLETLIQYMQTHADVWFATHEDIARYVKGGGESLEIP